MSNSWQPHGLQHARLLCPLLSPRVCSNSCVLNWWYYLTMKAFRLLLIKLRLASMVNLLVLLLPGLWAPLRSWGREGGQEGSCWHSLPQATRHTELLAFPPPGCSQKRIHTGTRRHCSEKRIQMAAQLISEIWQQQQWKHASTFPSYVWPGCHCHLFQQDLQSRGLGWFCDPRSWRRCLWFRVQRTEQQDGVFRNYGGVSGFSSVAVFSMLQSELWVRLVVPPRKADSWCLLLLGFVWRCLAWLPAWVSPSDAIPEKCHPHPKMHSARTGEE